MCTIPESLNLSLKTDDSTYPHETDYRDHSEKLPTILFDSFNISNVSSLHNLSPINPSAFEESSFYTTRSDCKCNECNLF
ncbi:unnamed protein product [Blepharisma stoltei]|uniref:Uncharacterized protein n=1 Tax=Blepharisma stoltei TaxID=1481888 RepID=A0AAU9J7D0_9CILI|nr:unnamed protein product [Blepharisma stoltei]